MRKVTLGGHVVTIYDSIDEMPIVNFSRYNKFLLIDSGIGSNINDIDIHIERVARYIKVKPDLAIQELLNLRQSLYFVNQQVNPTHLAFASLIAEVDGVSVSNASEDNLTELLHILNGTSVGDIAELLDSIKKKVETELSAYFPELTNTTEEKEAFDKLKQRTLLVLDSILHDTDNSSAIDDIDNFFLLESKPKSFSGSNSAEVIYVKEFEKACILISQETGLQPKTLVVLQFYLALEQIKKSIKNKTKQSHVR